MYSQSVSHSQSWVRRMRPRTLLKSVRTVQVCRGLNSSALSANFYNSEQEAVQETTQRVLEEVVNQDWELWEKEKIFPGKKVFKKFGEAGLLGIHKPTEYGGQGLGYKYHVAFLEALGHCKRFTSTSLC